MDDFYDLLEVPEDASQADVKRAWREKAREYHPDVNDDVRASGQFKTLRVAFEVLSDETKREAYDRMGHEAYVDRRLDGLPTTGVPARGDRSRGGRWDDSATGARGGAAGSGRSDAGRSSTRSAGGSRSTGNRTSSTSASGSTGRSRAGSSSSRSRSRTGSSGSSTGRSRAGGTGRSAAASSRRSGGGPTASGSANASATATATEGAAGASSFVPPHLTRRWRTFVGATLAWLLYLGGLAVYLRPNVDSLSAFAAAVRTTPRTALTTDYGLPPPGAFSLAAVDADPGPALAFPAAAALLGVVFLVVLRQMPDAESARDYYLYLYPLGGLLAVASLALGTAVSVPATALSLAVVALPLVTTTAYLVDLGEYLADNWE